MTTTAIWNNRIRAFAFGIAIALSVVIAPCWWSIIRDGNPSCAQGPADFIAFYTAARMLRTDAASLYDLDNQRLLQQSIDPVRGDWAVAYYYPPFLALALLPLAWLPFSQAFIVMTVINLALLFLSIKILIHRLQLNREQSGLLILATLCNYGLYYALLEGQTSFIALTLLTLFVTDSERDANVRTGIWSGALFFKPQLAVIPFYLLILRKKWLSFAWAAGTIGFLFLISLCVLGMSGLQDYIHVTGKIASEPSYFRLIETMQNLRGLIYFFVDDTWQNYAWWTSTAVIVGIAAVHSWRDDITSPARWTHMLVSLLLVVPHLHEHDLTLLIIPSAFFLKSRGDLISPAALLFLIMIAILPIANTLGYPYLPPLVPILLLSYLTVAYARERHPNQQECAPMQ